MNSSDFPLSCTNLGHNSPGWNLLQKLDRFQPLQSLTPRKSQFNSVGSHYNKVSNNHDDRSCIFAPTIMRYFPNLSGLFVHDLATGDGTWAKLFVKLGADCVAAIDESEYQLQVAKGNMRTCKDSLRITLINEDVASVHMRRKILPSADVAFAGFLLHFAQSKDALERMCKNIAKNLKPGAPFFALNSNPENPLFKGRRYFCEISTDGELEEGKILTVTDYDKRGILQPCRFQIVHWNKQTYENVLEKAGFCDIKWNTLVLSEDISAYPPGYWDYYISNQPTKLLECRKK